MILAARGRSDLLSGLDSDGAEVLFRNEPFRDLRPLAVKVMRPVSGFANQHETGIADEFQQ